jgi:DNA primase
MIPIRDHQGRVAAFTARQTELTPDDDPAHEAKYVNSPETPIFTKGNLLFNLDRARANVGEGKPFIMVEGQLDAMRCWHVGLKTTVAPQGTAITDTQLGLLRRYNPQIECFLDGDSAGQKAALRMLPLALRAGLEVKFLVLKAGEDPDSLFRDRGLPAYEEIRSHPLSAMAFACQAVLPEPATASPEMKSRAAQSIFEMVSQSEFDVARTGFLAECAEHMRLPVASLQRDFTAFSRRQTRAGAFAPSPPPAAAPAPAAKANRPPEDDLLLLCLHFDSLGKPMAQALLAQNWIDTVLPSGRILWRFLTEFEQDVWPGRDHLDELLETPEERALVASLLFEAPAIDDPRKAANEGLRRLQARKLEPRLRQIELEIAAKQTDGDPDSISLLWKERSEHQRLLRQPPVLPAAG